MPSGARPLVLHAGMHGRGETAASRPGDLRTGAEGGRGGSERLRPARLVRVRRPVTQSEVTSASQPRLPDSRLRDMCPPVALQVADGADPSRCEEHPLSLQYRLSTREGGVAPGD